MVLGIYGAGGLGREVLETARIINSREKRFEDIVFIIDNPTTDCVQGTRVMSLEAAAAEFGGRLEIVVSIGEPYTRLKVIDKVQSAGVKLTTLIHPDVYIPESTVIGNGCYIGPYAFISCNVVIGDYALIQPHSATAHDCRIGSNVVVSSMVAISGTVTVGDNTYLGAGASIIQGCTIGRDTIIGMGSVVTRDIPDNVVAMGSPARPTKSNDEKRVFK